VVQNRSNTAAALNTSVAVSISHFGIGMPRRQLATQTVNIGAGGQELLHYPVPQSVMDPAVQFIGVYVQVSHPFDTNVLNNKGSQVLGAAFTTLVGRAFQLTFPVMNPSSAPQQITLDVLSNELNAQGTPAARLFAPLEQIVATLTIQVPGTIHAVAGVWETRDVTVMARGGAGELIGGLTYLVYIED
jgi:hypothetical protein